ncbi:FadR/GntR family transcriptional regulator [Capillimicrobium parvum]|uniref:HTH-type transcriptional repressor NanR n=1 Tax=Capillimicrobium parvum TaxID=2884022 RepID=A0A9E6Y1C1_9ACTN|nr:FCD domain-containing protein [Capillimicrobium parvum]UGS38315.1 HTH-type transcriptional repressor NanR [Capillimicrobium parvum]
MHFADPTPEFSAPHDDRHLSSFQPIRQRTAADEVVGVLINAIRGGLYGPGDLLPRERDLAERLEVSRTVVREATNVLRRAEVVTVRRGRAGGVVVASLANLSSVVAQIRGETQETLQSVFEARRSLETTIALFAAERACAEQFERLDRLVEELESLLDQPQEFLVRDVQFHIAMGEFSGNPLLARLLRTVLDELLHTLAHFPVGRADLQHAITVQQGTLAAVRSGRADEIVREVDEHLAMLEETFLGRRLTSKPRSIVSSGV